MDVGDVGGAVMSKRSTMKPAPRPSDVLAYVPTTAPWKATPPYAMPRPDRVDHRLLCERSHDVRKQGRCEPCGLHRPKRGGWGVPCKGHG